MKRVMFGAILFAAALGTAGTARAAECSVIFASTPSGATFPCTICFENGRPISAICTPTPGR